jgi:hypothetical protein
VPIGTKGIAETETVERKQDVGRQTFPEAFHRLAARLRDGDV